LKTSVHHFWILLLVAVSSLPFRSCYKEQLIEPPEKWSLPTDLIMFDNVPAFTSTDNNTLLFTLPQELVTAFTPFVSLGAYKKVSIDGRKLTDATINNLGKVEINHPYTVMVANDVEMDTFQLYFTTLPLVRILTETEIKDEPKVFSTVEMQYIDVAGGSNATTLYSTFAGVEIRGRTSASHEKKSYGLELWKDRFGSDQSEDLLGMRLGEDWILDAMYIDPLRMRNKLSFELWEKLWKTAGPSPWRTVIPGIQCEYVELFINHRYMGIYALTERMDERLINVWDGTPGQEGVLYKAIDWRGGSTAFMTYNSEPRQSMIWEGWEQIFPDDHFCWGPLSELRKAVVMDNDEVFGERIDTLLDLDCAAEYYLFTNLLLAWDNIIKNYFVTRYPGESRFLLLPWDLEGTLGIMWDGDPSSSNGLVENNLFNRLLAMDEKDFHDLVESKWRCHRESVFVLDSLLAPAYEYADLLTSSGAVDRENRRWQGVEIDLEKELDYLSQWLILRLQYLDTTFD
jgi:hypothetical protein